MECDQFCTFRWQWKQKNCLRAQKTGNLWKITFKKMYKCYAGRTNRTGWPLRPVCLRSQPLSVKYNLNGSISIIYLFLIWAPPKRFKKFLSLNELASAIKPISTWILLTVHLNSIFDWGSTSRVKCESNRLHSIQCKNGPCFFLYYTS